jgi:hypothetical protein
MAGPSLGGSDALGVILPDPSSALGSAPFRNGNMLFIVQLSICKAVSCHLSATADISLTRSRLH